MEENKYAGLRDPAVPVLKLPGKLSRDGALATPRSLEAAEKAVADISSIAIEKEEEAAMLTARGQRAEAEAQQAASAARAAAKLAQANPSQRADAEEAALEAAAARQAAAAAQAQAAQTTRKAAVDRAAAAASEGTFVLVSQQGFGRSGVVTDRYALEAEAREAASQLWWIQGWILYHEQRGARTEVDCGGASFTHYMLRRYVSKATADAVNKALGGHGYYRSNY